MKFATRAIHAGQEPDPATGAVMPPIYPTSTFAQPGLGKQKSFVYSRVDNPTRHMLEACLASLENGTYALAFASGMAAESAILGLLSAGDHLVACDDLYGDTYRLFERAQRRYQIETSYVSARSIADYERALRPATRMIWLETPTNPLLHLVDIQAIAQIAHHHQLLLVVDNTFASPYFQQPLSLGADIVIESTTKYLSGHSDVLGGAAITNNEKLARALKSQQILAGAVPGPFDAWLILRGIKTLALRMRQHEENARVVAEYLSTHPRVEQVYYPGLSSHPDHELARRQMSGFGGMVSFQLKGGLPEVERVVQRFKLFTLAVSLGGIESLVSHPSSMTHISMPSELREARGLRETLLRLSVGIEDSEDLLADLEQALA
jgi:cystathionine gamma-lyase